MFDPISLGIIAYIAVKCENNASNRRFEKNIEIVNSCLENKFKAEIKRQKTTNRILDNAARNVDELESNGYHDEAQKIIDFVAKKI